MQKRFARSRASLLNLLCCTILPDEQRRRFLFCRQKQMYASPDSFASCDTVRLTIGLQKAFGFLIEPNGISDFFRLVHFGSAFRG